jgi:UV DNA damage endonuclease
VRAGAVRDLDVQAALLDAMGLGPEAVVVVHAGGGRGDALGRFEAGWAALSDAARARVVIENDDRVHALGAVLDLHRRTGARVVWDVLHHHCHDADGIPDREALALALATWPAGQTPKIHYSTPRTTMEARTGKGKGWVLAPPRAHADLIDPFAFARFLEDVGERHFDVMLEAKGKDLALLRLREQLRPATTAPRRARSAP